MRQRYRDNNGDFPESEPIKTDKGIKSRGKNSAARKWWAKRWQRALERFVTPSRLRRGKRYANDGQILTIHEKGTSVIATVQGSKRTPYEVTIALEPISDEGWEQIIGQLKEQAIFAAQLLAGEMPQDIELIFEAVDIPLFPDQDNQLITTCTCPDPVAPCKHVAAVHLLLGERFDEDPFMIFRLRGRSAEQLFGAIRQTPSITERDDPEPQPESQVVPLAQQAGEFWEMGQPLDQLQTTIAPPATEYPILKRLGQPSFIEDNLIELLGPAYGAVSQTALIIALGDDQEEQETNGA